MLLKKLHIRNFRNIRCATIELSSNVNLLLGENAQGKSNFLEAIHFLSTGKSFRSASLTDLIAQEQSYFSIEAEIEKEGITEHLRIYFDGQKKAIQYNHSPFSSFSQLLGIFPSVLIAPQDLQLIMGPPALRRRFLNIHIAQYDPLYVHHLTRYCRAMKHRNALLKSANTKSIECFEEQMSLSGNYLIEAREKGVQEMQEDIEPYFSALSSLENTLSIQYRPSCKSADLLNLLQKNRLKEMHIHTTLYGPHRDDFILQLNDKSAKSFASEGQKRTTLSALRLAEWKRLCAKTNSYALLAIDDFGIHLDEKRLSHLLHLLEKLPQVIITSPLKPSWDIRIAKKLMIKSGVLEII